MGCRAQRSVLFGGEGGGEGKGDGIFGWTGVEKFKGNDLKVPISVLVKVFTIVTQMAKSLIKHYIYY